MALPWVSGNAWGTEFDGWKWVLEGALVYPEPIPMGGKQGLWKLTEEAS